MKTKVIKNIFYWIKQLFTKSIDIEIELSEQKFNEIALYAHENEMTFNQASSEILEKYIKEKT